MLNALKSHHIKWILWMLVLIIVPAFIFFGVASFSGRTKNALGRIKGHTVSLQEFSDYKTLARIDTLLKSKERYPKELDPASLEQQAWQYYILLWEAKQQKISVSDQEVVSAVRSQFFGNNRFDRQTYENFIKYTLRVTPRIFEEYLRRMLTIDRLFEANVKPEISEEEVLDAYKKDNEKARITYLLIPFEQLEKEILPSEEQLNSFYQENTALFLEEPKVKITYIFISDNDYPDIKDALAEAVKNAKDLQDITSRVQGTEIKTTDFLSAKSPIDGIGWEPELLQQAFRLEKGSLSPLAKTHNGYIIYVKQEEREARTPALDEIRENVAKKIKEQEAKRLAQEKGETILAEARKGTDSLETLAKTFKADYNETEFFKYYDYIQGVGLNEDLSEAVFAAEKGQLIPQTFSLAKGVYLIRAADFQPIDQDKYSEEKDNYKQKLLAQKNLIERIRFFQEIVKSANLEIYGSSYQ